MKVGWSILWRGVFSRRPPENGSSTSAPGPGTPSAVERLLPPLVHRLNNALAVLGGVLELGPGARDEERRIARQSLLEATGILERLGRLSRASPQPQELDLEPTLVSIGTLCLPLARERGVRLEVRPPGSCLPARAGGDLESWVVAQLVQLLCAANRPTRVRVSARCGGGRALVALAWSLAQEPSGEERSPGDEEPALAPPALVARRLRRRGAVSVLMLTLAADRRLEVASSPGERSARVLLLQEQDDPGQEVVTLLREQGHTVTRAGALPGSGTYDLVLVDEGLGRGDPDFLALLRAEPRLRAARFVCLGSWSEVPAGVAHIEKPIPPRRLLDLVSGADRGHAHGGGSGARARSSG